jgi:hypothetical protein
MMEACGLSEIRFNEEEHFWCAVGINEGGPAPAPE